MNLRKYNGLITIISAIFILSSCGPQSAEKKKEKEKKPVQENIHRKKQKEPVDTTVAVATFMRNFDDELDNNDFAVNIYPTKKSAEFRIDIHYGKNRAGDILKLPPRDFFEKVAINPAESNDQCIVGFMDKKGKFNEMVKVSGATTSIQIKTLKMYYVQ